MFSKDLLRGTAALLIAAAMILTAYAFAGVAAAGLPPSIVSLLTEEDKRLVFGGCGYDPYGALRPYIQGGNVIPVMRGNELADGIDPALACRLSKFLEAANRICPTRIVSGYRSFEHQRNLCGPSGKTGCSAPGRSCHQYGLAVDLSSDCNGRLRQLAPQYQLHFPYQGVHVQCIEHRTAGRSSCTGPCVGGLPISTDAVRPSSSSPISSLLERVRESLGLEGAPRQGEQNCTLPDGLVVPCSAIQNPGAQSNVQTFASSPTPTQQLPSAQQPGQYLQPAQQPQSPASDASPAPIPISRSLSFGAEQTSATQSAEGEPLSVLDRLRLYAGLQTPTSTATSVPVVVVVRREDAAVLQSTSVTFATTSLLTENFYAFTPPVNQGTFVSPDLSGGFSSTFSQGASSYWNVLENMRQILLRVLDYLRPFGRPLEADHMDSYSDWSE